MNVHLAVEYAKAGFFVFPCSPERRKREPRDRLPFGKADKRPLVSSWSKDASNDPARVCKWWSESPHALVGLPCKQNKLLVIDADRHSADEDGVAHFEALCEAHGPLPPHPVVLTDYEGEHHIFRMPSSPVGNRKIGIGLETRGYLTNNDGGYIIAPGSRMRDGRTWELLKGTPSLLDGPLPGPSRWLIELCYAPKGNFGPASAPHSTVRREEAYATKALEARALKLASTPPGNRNNAANISAYSMGRLIARGWIEEGTVKARLFDACRYNGLVDEDGEAKVRATLRSGIKAGVKNPHPDLQERPTSAHLNGGPKQSYARAFDDPDWSLLDTQRGSLPDFPLEVLGPNLQEVIRRTSKGAGVTHAHVAVPLLGITSGLIGYSRRLKATASWFQPATCWTALVGYSGTGKTPGHNVTRRAAKEVEQLRKKHDEKRKRDYETKKLAAKAARDNWEKKVKEATEAGVPTPEMPEAAVDPGKYVPTRLIVNDGTIERLAELLQARPQGIVLVRDELAALFMNMSRYSGGQDDEFWLESWNGELYTVERMGRTLSVDHLLIGVVGGMQPDKLVASFEGDHDGKYARMLFAWPDEPGWLGLNNDATEIDTDIYNIISRILTLAEFTQEGRLVSHSIGLDSEAAGEFAQFAQFAHQEKSAFEGREREWFAKATAHVLRLANTLTHVEWALTTDTTKPVTVNKTTMQAAIRLVRDYFWPHARACLRLIGLTERHTDARRVLLWIRAKGKTVVSLMDIRRHALNERLDEEQTEALLSHLERGGWVRKHTKPSGPAGGKPIVRWVVNPILFSNPGAETAETAET